MVFPKRPEVQTNLGAELNQPYGRDDPGLAPGESMRVRGKARAVHALPEQKATGQPRTWLRSHASLCRLALLDVSSALRAVVCGPDHQRARTREKGARPSGHAEGHPALLLRLRAASERS